MLNSKNLVIFIFPLFVILFACCFVSHALDYNDMMVNQPDKKRVQDSEDQQWQYESSNEDRKPLQDFKGRKVRPQGLGIEIDKDQDFKEGSLLDDLKLLKEQPKQKIRLLLKAEPGDGLVRLSWQIPDYRKPLQTEELRFKILIGTTSERVEKAFDVGTGSAYTLRNLQNHQTYFIQVEALDRQKARIARSDEIKATPLPAEEHGSVLEKTFSRKNQTLHEKMEPEPFKRELRQFGYDFFKNSAQLAGSVDNQPVGENYVLGPGDSIALTIWGAINIHHELTVDRNGEIVIPRVGVVKIWGLSYDKAKEAIEKSVSRYFKNFELHVTLGKLRTIQVFVLGEVESPGNYPVASLATVVNALSAAGGPTKNGSLRTIKVIRSGKTVEEIDLYEMLLSGNRSKDIRLQNGDTIFVPVIGPVVAVAGEAKRPAIYETKGKQTLADVLQMAGGITASGYTGRIQIERFSGNNSRIALDYEPKDGKLESSAVNVEIFDRDMVKIFVVQETVRQIISLKGNVARPGEYQFRKGMHVKDIITAFSDLLPESHLESAEITRLALPDFHKEIFTINLGKAINGDESDNITLQEQDSIKVFSRWEMQEKPFVQINGQVVAPGKYDYNQGMTVRDLVSAAGSLKHNALLDMAELSRIAVTNNIASSLRLPINLGKAISGDIEHNMVLQPNDVLIVRGIVGWTESTDKFVQLNGEVMYPGTYSIAKGEKLSSVIVRAGGYTDKAYLRGARFTRRSVRYDQQKRMDEVIVKTEKDIAQKQALLASTASSKEELEATKTALESLLGNVQRMKSLKAEGRVVINLTPLDKLRKSTFDLEMEPGDILDIPARTNVVNVMGYVYNPSSYVFNHDKTTIDYYLNMSGGATNDADKTEIYVIRADGTVFSKQQSSFGLPWSKNGRWWSFGGFMSSTLESGDTLVVPQKLERTAWLREIKDITTIISQIALTAGTIFIGLK